MDRKEIEFERATKNTYRFQEKSTGSPVIGIRGEGAEEGEGYGGVGIMRIIPKEEKKKGD